VAIIAWIVSFATLFGGLALQQDVPFAHAHEIANGLFLAAFLACPVLWHEKPFGVNGKSRFILCLAMVLALPLVLMPAQ
jgi:hypothetical protein